MRKTLRILAVSAGAVAAMTAGTAVAPSAGAAPAAYTCTGGQVPSGTYASVTVTGFCDVAADAVITIVGNLNVPPGAVFDAQSVASTITVGHNVTAGAGSLLGLGCQPFGYVPHAAHPCMDEPGAHSTISVKGNVTATDADTVLLNGITVDGNVTLTGGGGDIPWAEKNNTIGGNVTFSNITPEWLGLLFNHIAGNATLTNITATDPGEDPGVLPAVSVVGNMVGRNLNCTGLGPRLAGGALPNVAGHKVTGQCTALV